MERIVAVLLIVHDDAEETLARGAMRAVARHHEHASGVRGCVLSTAQIGMRPRPPTIEATSTGKRVHVVVSIEHNGT